MKLFPVMLAFFRTTFSPVVCCRYWSAPLIIIAFLLQVPYWTLAQTDNVGIGTVTPHPNSLLDLSSINKGLLVPRLNSVQRILINPLPSANGLLVYDTDINTFCYWNSATSDWICLDNLTQGADGATGPQGPTGLTGATGPQGIAGINGINGIDGVDGATGPQGIQGPTGVAGAIGPQGIPGTNGIDGIDGVDGATGPQGIQGPTGVTGAIGPPGIAGTNGTDGIDGVDGATGPQGIQGPTGVAGAIGPQGIPGTNGIDGIDGVDGAIGPQGIQGPTGLTGATGPQGIPGTNGTNGIDGINGVDGATGPQGIQGPTGLTGATGPQGIPGTNGTNGIDGIDGVDGATGPQGIQGPTGLTGATGPQGIQGPTGLTGAIGPTGPSGSGGKGYLLNLGHSNTNLIKNSTYVVGYFWNSQALTLFNDRPSRRAMAPAAGNIKSVQVMSAVAGTLAGVANDNITIKIRNWTQNTEAVLVTTYGLSSGNLLGVSRIDNFILALPLAVNEGDQIQVRLETPDWITEPTQVYQIFNVYVE